jgi:ATP-dependent helicase HrpA
MLNLNLRNFPELPGSIISTLGYQKGPVQVFPGISLEEGHRVNLRLFLNQDQALSETQKGARQLLIDYLNKEFKYLLKNCIPQGLSPETCLSFGGEQKLRLSIYAFLCRELLGSWEQIPSRSDLLNRAEKIKGKVFQQAIPHIQLLKEVLVKHSKARQEIGRLQNTEINRKTCAHILKELKAELTRLTPPDFPENARSDQLPHLPRYLNALAVRAVRAYADPLKDKTKASTLEPFLLRINKAKDHLKTKNTKELTEEIRQFEMLVDEYRVSVFAPELGTSTPVSSKRLRDAWERLKVLF